MAISIRASSTPLGSHAGLGLLKSPFAACNNSKHSRKQASIARAYISTAPTNNKDPYTTLGLPAGASEQDIKKAYRRLALQFHPDVCKGDSCTAKFIQIGQAYESIMDCVKGRRDSNSTESCYDNVQESMMGVNDDSWEDWEDWMGWEGAGTRDYYSHINYATSCVSIVNQMASQTLLIWLRV